MKKTISITCFCALVSACGFENLEDDYLGLLTAEADMSAMVPLSADPSDVSAMTGTATYTGFGGANFNTGDTELASFTGAAEVTLVADFDDDSLSGEMSNWVSSNANSEYLDGSVILSNGVISGGTITGDVNGAISRRDRTYPDARTGVAIDSYNLIGTFTGGFYDTTDGAASHVFGSLDAVFNGDDGTIDGSFIAAQ